MAPQSLRNILLLSVLFPFALSVPTTDPSSSAEFPTSLRPKAIYSHTEKPVGPFRRLRNALIERIWSIPGSSAPEYTPTSASSPGVAPENFRARYGADVVLRFRVNSEDEARALAEASNILYLDIWEATDEWVDIRIAKDVVPSFIGLLPPSLRDSYTPLMHDLARAVYDTYPQSSSTDEGNTVTPGLTTLHDWASGRGAPEDLFFRDYQPLSVLYPWLRLIASLFPNHASLTSIGLSAEGRDIPALRIGARPANDEPDHGTEKRQTLLIVGGTHAREWISVSTSAYIAYNLVTRYGHPQYPYVTKILDHFDVVFVPVLNPDGYEYTWTTDRLWRKNRQATSLPFCPGIDIGRSFPFGWDGFGETDNPCSDSYAGPAPLAGTEAQVLFEWARNQTDNNNVELVSFLDLHSYSQQVLYPYSYTCDVSPPTLEDLEEVALGLAKSFRLTNGHYYGVESACEGGISFQAHQKDHSSKRTRIQADAQGGSALDFFYHDLLVKFSFQIKLRDTGNYGFLLPRSNIVPTGEEAYEAVVGLGRWLLGNRGIESVKGTTVWGPEPAPGQDNSRQDKPAATEVHAAPAKAEEEKDDDDYLYDDLDFELRRRRRRR
ncbi:Inactive metallocarboxypeptidase ECM14 [Exophiala dermatitidis]